MSEDMILDVEKWSHEQKTEFLSRLASQLTISARDSYEAGTDRVLQPEVLRAYNELLHRVTAAVLDHLLARDGFPVDVILEMVRAFGERNERTGEMRRVLDRVSTETS